MAKLQLKVGATSQRVFVFIQDSTATTGVGKTGLAFNSSGLKWYTAREDDGNAAGTSVSPVTATKGTFASGGFVEKDATNMPGVYEIGIPNASLATGSKYATIMLSGVTGMAPVLLEIELVAYDPFDTVRLGLTALPNAAAEAAGGLYTRGTGAGQINQDANGRIDANTKAWIGGTIPAVNVTGVPLIDLKYTLGTISPATAGSVRADAVTGAVGSVTGAVGSVTGAVGSVTGAVGSVTGAVGSVTGAVGSVTGAVGSVTGLTASDVGAIKAKTDNLPAAPADESLVIAATNAIYSRIGAPAGASVSADIAAVKVDTAAVKAKTDNLPASPAAVSDIPTAVANADALLGRNISGGSSSGRTVKQALHFIRNKWVIGSSTLTVYDVDDTTSSWTAAVGTDAAAIPIISNDPA